MVDLGLSQSRLNDRYHSVEQLAPIKPVLANTTYMSKQELDFEYPDVSSVGTSNRGGPRYIKSQYAGKKAPPGSHSSRAQIEKTEFAVRSSAMSDTSEAPSLASHVRRVRVPSQASDVDQFLDELFSPVLDGNLDELSDARSLAASIKGGGSKNNPLDDFDNFLSQILEPIEDQEVDLSDPMILATWIKGGGDRSHSDPDNSLLDKEVENLTLVNGDSQMKKEGNVDDYISDLFRPIFINDSIKNLTEKHNLVESIKGGGTTHHQQAGGSSSYNFSSIPSPVGSPQPVMMQQEGFMSLYSMQNSLPGSNPDIAAYQQNLQRAFLQSAMAQNIQIQQQLLAQNQALQQLLTQQSVTEVKTIAETIQTQVRQSVSPDRKSSFKSNRKNSSSNSMLEFKSRKASSESIVRNGVPPPPPPPPPMPPPLDPSDPSETRPFLDPYGRAKTVRIGKWRWPPPKDGNNQENGEDFMHFKLRQNQRKITPNKEQFSVVNGHGVTSQAAEWEEIDFEPALQENDLSLLQQPPPPPSAVLKVNARRSFEVGANRPSPGSIGKLKLSSEMRQRLEMVTSHHSIRSTSSKSEKPARTINKLEDTRKMMLEQQLMGRWGDSMDGSQGPPSNSPSPETLSHHKARSESKSPTQHSWTSSNWRPGPPPPPIGPSSLPPVPLGPAPPPPIRPLQPPQPIEPIRDSFMAKRQDRDTFGVHQNRVNQNSSKRNSFSANWEIQSSLTQETHQDDWSKEKLEFRKDSWDQNLSSTEVTPRRNGSVTSDRWEPDPKIKSPIKEPTERPTFRTHQMNKIALEREKKHSVSTVNTEKAEKLEG